MLSDYGGRGLRPDPPSPTGVNLLPAYDGKILEQVKEFKYLGTTLSASGSLMCVCVLTKPIFLC